MKKVKTLDKNIEDNDIEKKKFSFKNIEAKYYVNPFPSSITILALKTFFNLLMAIA